MNSKTISVELASAEAFKDTKGDDTTLDSVSTRISDELEVISDS